MSGDWLGFAGVLVTAFVAWQNGRIHKLVNSRFSAAEEEIKELHAVIKALTETGDRRA